MRNLPLLLLMLVFPLTLAACETLTSSLGRTGLLEFRWPFTGGVEEASAAAFCDVGFPIYWSQADTDETIRQVKLHNEAGKVLCGWTGGASIGSDPVAE